MHIIMFGLQFSKQGAFGSVKMTKFSILSITVYIYFFHYFMLTTCVSFETTLNSIEPKCEVQQKFKSGANFVCPVGRMWFTIDVKVGNSQPFPVAIDTGSSYIWFAVKDVAVIDEYYKPIELNEVYPEQKPLLYLTDDEKITHWDENYLGYFLRTCAVTPRLCDIHAKTVRFQSQGSQMLTFTNIQFCLATKLQISRHLIPEAKKLGLPFGLLGIGQNRHFEEVESVNFLSEIQDQLDQRMFAIKISPNGYTGEFSLGKGINEYMYLPFIQVEATAVKGFWSFIAERVTVYYPEKRRDPYVMGEQLIILDTGERFVRLNKYIFEQSHPTKGLLAACSSMLFSLVSVRNHPIKIIIEIDKNRKLELSEEDLIQQDKNDPSQCFSELKTDEEDFNVLGVPFFRKYYTEFHFPPNDYYLTFAKV